MKTLTSAAFAFATLLTLAPTAAAQVPSPEAHFGFRMGADRRLIPTDGIEQYFRLIASQTDRVVMTDIGMTTEGHPTIAAIVSAPENIRNLDAIRAVNQRLADPRTLSPEDARRLAATHKTVIAIGAGIHSTEVGATLAANELLFTLATATDDATLNILRNVVLILIPSLNPDGHRLVVDWYNRTLDTPFEGGPMPWLYHKYAGHDINRDAFMMNLAENRNLARFFYTNWHPQVFLTMHQMEENGPRFFVPPNTDPIDLNYDPLIWRTSALLGNAMALELQREGKTGVMSSAKYDYYWPGFEDSAPLGHNTVCLLTEVASVNIASPVTISPADLRAGFKGLPDYRPQINFPDPWPGGRWTLQDIVDYELIAVRGLLFAAAAYRETLVHNFYEMGRRAVQTGQRGEPFAFFIPADQYDRHAAARLEELLLQGAVEIHRALEPFRADGDVYPEGTDMIFLAQPFRAYAKTLLEKQAYPARRPAPAGPTERPYDVAGWTLPDQMGVRVITIARSFEPPPTTRLMSAVVRPDAVWGERRPTHWLIDGRGNAGAIAANRLVAAGANPAWIDAPIELDGFRFEPGSIVVPYLREAEPVIAGIARDLGLRADGAKGRVPVNTRPIGRARIGVYRSWTEGIDEGWTRWLLDRYEFRHTSVTDADIKAGNLRARFDVIVLPSLSAERIRSGFPDTVTPPEYTGGLGETGVEALRVFTRAGGTLVCMGQATALGIDLFELPIKDVARDADDRVFVPGSVLRIELDPTRPLAYGMPARTSAFFAFSSAFEAASAAGAGGRGFDPAPAAGMETIAHYASTNLLVSGWLEGEPLLAGRAAVVQAAIGSGRVVLFGFPVQHRGQSLATFRFLFNALLPNPIAPPAR